MLGSISSQWGQDMLALNHIRDVLLLGDDAGLHLGQVVAISKSPLIELRLASDRSLQILRAVLRQFQLLRLLHLLCR